MNEATARIRINRLLEKAGWRFFQEGSNSANVQLEPSVAIKQSELDALGDDFERASNERIDFLLLFSATVSARALSSGCPPTRSWTRKESAPSACRSPAFRRRWSRLAPSGWGRRCIGERGSAQSRQIGTAPAALLCPLLGCIFRTSTPHFPSLPGNSGPIMGAWYPTFEDIRSTPGITTLVVQAGVHTVFLTLPIPETSGFAVSVVVYVNVECTRSVHRHVERVDRYVGRSLHEDCVPHHLGRLSRCQVYDRDVRNAGLPMRQKLRQVEIDYALSGSIRRGLVSRPRSPSVRRSKYKLVSFIRMGPHPNPLGSGRDWQRVQYLFVVCGVTPAEPELTNGERQQHKCCQYAERYRRIFLLTDQSQIPYHPSSQLSHFGGVSVTKNP